MKMTSLLRRKIAWVLVGLALSVSVGILLGSHPGNAQDLGGDIIHACVRDRVGLAIIVGQNEPCPPDWSPTEWNVEGPAGPPGPGDTGPPGPAGPPGGVSAIESVTAVSGLDSATEKSVLAECPMGKVVLGGGARLVGASSEVAFTANIPITGEPPTGWLAEAKEVNLQSGRWSIEIRLICAIAG